MQIQTDGLGRCRNTRTVPTCKKLTHTHALYITSYHAPEVHQWLVTVSLFVLFPADILTQRTFILQSQAAHNGIIELPPCVDAIGPLTTAVVFARGSFMSTSYSWLLHTHTPAVVRCHSMETDSFIKSDGDTPVDSKSLVWRSTQLWLCNTLLPPSLKQEYFHVKVCRAHSIKHTADVW